MLLAGLALAATLGAADPNQSAATGDAYAPSTAGVAPARGHSRVYILPIQGKITDLTFRVLERGVAEARDAGATAIVFDVDTPGGLVSAAIDISSLIKKTRDAHTVAWVNPEAISAGALISLGCDEIVVAPRSKIGDCAAIMVGPQGMQNLGETERAKIDSYILAEFRDSAQANGYPLALCEAMVTLGPAIYRIRNAANDEVEYVYADQLARYGLSESDALQPASASGEDPNAAAATTDPNAPAASAWTIDRRVLKERSLLTMLGEEAREYGFATAAVADQDELLQHLDAAAAQVTRLQRTWSEMLVGYLTSPIMQGLLTIILLMGLYSEMQAPGIGIAGLIALLAGAILLGAPYLAGLAEWWEILLIFAGFGLLAIELFVIPGFGVAGVSGIICIFVGLLLLAVPNEIGPGVLPTLPGTWDALLNSLLSLVVSLAVSLVGIAMLTRYFGSIPLVHRLMLSSGESTALADAPGPLPQQNNIVKVGDTGRALHDLRPAGEARFGDRFVDVVTVGNWIEAGSGVRVTQVRGNRIVVEEA